MKPLQASIVSPVLVVMLISCAGQAPPAGGPEDFIPPEIISVYPAPYTTFYRDHVIVLEFDEFVDRNSVQESIFISPPVGKLEFDWSGKEVEISFSSDLRENTTYVTNVGTDVKDIRRGNRMARAFTLAFSTGGAIDRGAIAGTVYPIIRGADANGVMMFAYKLQGIDKDTLNPRVTEPDYVTQSGSDGSFFFHHVSLGPYRIIAVRDEYRNFLYDPETDEYGVLQNDILLTESDTLVSGLVIRLAKEDTTAPRLVKASAVNERLVTVGFSEPVDTTAVGPMSFEIRDTLTMGLLPVSAVAPLLPDRKDFLLVTDRQSGVAGYSVAVRGIRDSVGIMIDPLAASHVFEGSGTPDTIAPTILAVSIRDSARGIPMEPVIMVTLSEPVRPMPWQSVVAFDHGGREVGFTGRWAGNAVLELRPVRPLSGLAWYQMTVKGGWKDFAGNAGKDTSWIYRFETMDPDLFGGIEGRIVTGEEGAGNAIVFQAYNTNRKTISTTIITRPGPFSFQELLEGRYTLDAYRDRTGNGLYDPGRVFPFRPSAPFTIHSDTIRVRARWPVEGVKMELR